MADIAQESAVDATVEATKEVCGENIAEAVKQADAEEKVHKDTTESCNAEAENLTAEPESTGVKRKVEDDEDDEVKKVKSDSCHGEAEPSAPEDLKLVSNGDENGCGKTNKHAEGGDEHGQAAGDVPPEIVTKTVDEAVNQTEDVAASS